MKQDEAFDPIDIGIFCADGVMHDPQLRTQRIEQFRPPIYGGLK